MCLTNAKEELLTHLTDSGKGVNDILCVEITSDDDGEGMDRLRKLLVGYSEDDLIVFLGSLDFNYDSGYGGQELHGTIWYKDGTWSERGEYDGSEWWEYINYPEIPNYLKENYLKENYDN